MIEPIAIRLESTTYCQLKCPSCPTAHGEIGSKFGNGFLDPESFKKLVDQNPAIVHVELSNWGEFLLNQNLAEIVKYAYEKGVVLTASNGVNMNTARKDILEVLVKYKFRQMTCSIDGASQESYSKYRINGNFDRVIEHIREINRHKQAYNTTFPRLLWKFILFKHNQHEVDKARKMAAELDMDFFITIPWDDPNSPPADPEIVRSITRSHVSNRKEYSDKYGSGYQENEICKQMWNAPQINWDGRMLGCCVNRWGDYGNVFESGFSGVINNEKINYARDMLLGRAEARSDIPCTSCDVYINMKRKNNWLKSEETRDSRLMRMASTLGRFGVRLANKSELVGRNTIGRLIDQMYRDLP